MGLVGRRRAASLLRQAFVLDQTNLGRRVAHGTGYQFLGMVLRTGVTLVSTAVLALMLAAWLGAAADAHAQTPAVQHLRQARNWGYQLQHPDAAKLAASPYDVLVIDHSRHGTFLNGARVQARARLAAGDTLRLGTPGVSLELVALAEG